jgi:Fe2+ or Zn2+ uptake regulation protein
MLSAKFPIDAENNRLTQALAAAGYKLTQPRRAVLDVMADSADTLGPAEILSRARRLYPQVGLTTVYRTMELLADLCLVRRIHTEDGCHGYALRGADHGHHLICRTCSQVVEFEDCDLSPIIGAVAERTGFAIQDHWLELFGVCPRCQREASRARA